MIDIKKNISGFTLLESLVALAIFMAVVIPLLTRTYQSALVTRDRDKITGICLLDQEATLLRNSPSTILPLKKRTIGKTVWEIRTEATGEKLVCCKLKAICKGVVVTESVVYANK